MAVSGESIDPAALAILTSTPAVLQSLLGGLPLTVLTRPNPEGWSIKDIVAHLIDTEEIAFNVRIGRIDAEDRPLIRSIDPPARLLEGGFAARELADLLDTLTRRRASSVAYVRALTPAQLARTGMHDSAGTITPRNIIHQWAYHDLAHTRQIMEMIQATLVHGMGNMRDFYPETGVLLPWQ